MLTKKKKYAYLKIDTKSKKNYYKLKCRWKRMLSKNYFESARDTLDSGVYRFLGQWLNSWSPTCWTWGCWGPFGCSGLWNWFRESQVRHSKCPRITGKHFWHNKNPRMFYYFSVKTICLTRFCRRIAFGLDIFRVSD